MKINIKKLHPAAVIPAKAHSDDFCYDVTATSREEIAPNVYKYGLGFAVEIVKPWEYRHTNLSLDFRSRSSVWKTGLVLSNCVGTIDEGYRGEICAVFYHVIKELPPYEVGDRIGQIKIGVTTPAEFAEVEELNDTERGGNGYGSTGR